MIKADTQLLYSSDYPHWDMDLPSTILDLPFLGEQSKRNILGLNAQRIFNLDVSDRFPNVRKPNDGVVDTWKQEIAPA
jgi:hypothetical protein